MAQGSDAPVRPPEAAPPASCEAREHAEGGRLDNNAKSSRHRTARWEARGFLWEHSSLPRVKKCGRVTITPDGSVGVRADGRSVGYAGLHTCGSVWACPVCNTKIQAVRGLELGVALSTHLGAGGGAAFGSFTVRHHSDHPLVVTLRALLEGNAAIARDRTVKRLREGLGYLGRVNATEVTVGQRNGWHPHRHPLAFFAAPPAPHALTELHMAESRAFRTGVERSGLEAPLKRWQVLQPVELDHGIGDYLTKSTWTPEGAGFEMTATQTKKAGRGGRTPWRVLDGARRGDADDLDLWNEYERATRGRAALMWSRGLRDRLGLGDSASDEEVAAAEVGSDADTGFRIHSWAPFAADPGLGAGLLNAITPQGDWTAGRAFCRRHGIDVVEAS